MRRIVLLVCMTSAFVFAVDAPSQALEEVLTPGGSFLDDDGHFAEPHIEATTAEGLLDGCGEAGEMMFCPTMRAAWADAERAVGKVLGSDADLACGAEFCSAVSVPISTVAAALGYRPDLFTGFGIDPNAPLTRGTLAALLAYSADLELPEVPQRRSFTMAFTGDILPHTPVMSQAARNAGGDGGFDFSPMFSSIESIISAADLALCHLETPLSADNTNLSSYPVFYSPREVADAVVAAGYDGCSTASNHSYDKRTVGVESTLAVVEAAGLGYAGTADASSDAAFWPYDVNGVAVAHLSYTYGLNGFRLPADQPWLVNLIDEQEILADAAEARAAGAEFIVVSLHWGNEYQHRPSSYQTGIAENLLESPDIDVIVGHHAHVVQAVEVINGKYVLYGLGNLVSNQFFSLPTQDGVIAVLHVSEDVDGMFVRSIEFIPTMVERGTYRIIPIPDELVDDPDSDRAGALIDSWERTSGFLAALDESIAELVVPIR